jgi:hypothetical protein
MGVGHDTDPLLVVSGRNAYMYFRLRRYQLPRGGAAQAQPLALVTMARQL